MIAAAVAAALALAAADPPARDRDIEVSEGHRVYGLPTADALAAEGYTGVRVFVVDAWGRYRGAAAVLRKGEAPPQVLAWTKGQPAGVRALTGEVNHWDWRATRLLMDEVRATPERQPEYRPSWLEPPKADDEEGDSIFICTDSWTAAVEVIEGDKVTRRQRSSCGDDVAYDGATFLIDLAADNIEGCSTIQLRGPNWPTSRLNACSILTGEDRWDDADLANAVDRAAFSDPDRKYAIGEVLDPAVRLTLADGSLRQGPAVADWYAAELARHEDTGLQTDDVSVKGEVGRMVGGLWYLDGFDAYFWAPSEQTWRRDDKGVWRLVAWTVGPWRRDLFTD